MRANKNGVNKDQKDKVKKDGYNRGQHCVYCLTYHMIFVTHYPSRKRPFYTMDDPDDPEYTLSFDLLFRGMEITSGGQRVHDYFAQVEKMKRLICLLSR